MYGGREGERESHRTFREEREVGKTKAAKEKTGESRSVELGM